MDGPLSNTTFFLPILSRNLEIMVNYICNDPFFITNKFLLKINGSDRESLETFSILITFPELISATIMFPLELVKYKFFFPNINPIGFILILSLIYNFIKICYTNYISLIFSIKINIHQ